MLSSPLFFVVVAVALDDLFVSQVYQEDFDAISRKFISLHHRVSDMLERNRSVPLKKLKRLLSTYADIKGPLKSARSYYDVMCVVLEHSSIINCSSLSHIAEYFNLPEVTRELDEYKEQVDEFCQKKIREHSYVKLIVDEQPKRFLSTQTITLKLEWKPDKKTLADIQSLIRKTFHSLSDLIHVVVISEGSVTVVCYAPHYIMGALVQMAEESRSMLLENGVFYISIGYAVVLDSEKVRTSWDVVLYPVHVWSSRVYILLLQYVYYAQNCGFGQSIENTAQSIGLVL